MLNQALKIAIDLIKESVFLHRISHIPQHQRLRPIRTDVPSSASSKTFEVLKTVSWTSCRVWDLQMSTTMNETKPSDGDMRPSPKIPNLQVFTELLSRISPKFYFNQSMTLMDDSSIGCLRPTEMFVVNNWIRLISTNDIGIAFDSGVAWLNSRSYSMGPCTLIKAAISRYQFCTVGTNICDLVVQNS